VTLHDTSCKSKKYPQSLYFLCRSYTPTTLSSFSSFQRLITELDQNLRPHVEQAITTGKRLYGADNKDSSGVESAGK
jgi:hypothetical protein